MKVKKIFFAGLGGAGQRHLRIFKDLLPADVEFLGYRKMKKTPLLNKDFSVNNEMGIEEKYGIRMLSSFEEGLEEKPDIVVVATPTAIHFEQALKAVKNGSNVLVEKPFSCTLDGFDEFEEIVIENNLCVFVSFQRRFHPYLKMIKDFISEKKIGDIVNAAFNVCSYVPAWHPYEDFTGLYACREDLGGGVILTEIHELDLCYWYFGMPSGVYCDTGNYSDVAMDVEDTAHIILKYQDFSVNVNLCFMQQHNRRDLYIAGVKGYMEWNADGNTFYFEDYQKRETRRLQEARFTNDDMFYNQARFFIDNIDSRFNKEYLDIAKSSLIIAAAAKRSAIERRLIDIQL